MLLGERDPDKVTHDSRTRIYLGTADGPCKSRCLGQLRFQIVAAGMSDLRIAPRRIEDYAIVGDCKTAALIAINGSIDWLCWPRFDSAACFAALLGGSECGRWLIAPNDETTTRVSRHYLRSSPILVTTFDSTTGAVELVDFMPPGDDAANLVRIVRGVRGRVSLRTEFIVRFDYGSIVPWVEHLPDEGLRGIAGPEMVVLHTPVPLHGRDFVSVGKF